MINQIIEFSSAFLILLGIEFINRKNIKGFLIVSVGQFLATIICGISGLWFLTIMHFVNFLLQLRGYHNWRKLDRFKVE